MVCLYDFTLSVNASAVLVYINNIHLYTLIIYISFALSLLACLFLLGFIYAFVNFITGKLIILYVSTFSWLFCRGIVLLLT